MKAFAASANIKAAPATIWRIITDAPGYPSWDPGVERIEGTIAPGEKITARTKLNPGRAFPLTVTEFLPNERMTWSGGMPLGLFTGVRTFLLTAKGDGSVDFALREEFSGPLSPIFGRMVPDMTQAFQDLVAGLKARAEAL